MNIPTEIIVAGITYKINLKDFIEIEGNRNYQGACRYTSTEIDVLSTTTIERQQEILVHELLHAILFESGFREHEEELVERVGKVLYQVLKDNKFNFKS